MLPWPSFYFFLLNEKADALQKGRRGSWLVHPAPDRAFAKVTQLYLWGVR